MPFHTINEHLDQCSGVRVAHAPEPPTQKRRSWLDQMMELPPDAIAMEMAAKVEHPVAVAEVAATATAALVVATAEPLVAITVEEVVAAAAVAEVAVAAPANAAEQPRLPPAVEDSEAEPEAEAEEGAG